MKWVIPENIHTIPRTASWNSEGEGGVSWTGIPKTWGDNAVWNSKGMGGCFSSEFSEFPEERRRKLRLKSQNRQHSQFVSEARTDHGRSMRSCRWVSRWVVQQAPHRRGLKVDELVN